MSAVLFVQHARKMLKTAWRHRGRSDTGVDCLGLIEVAAHRAGKIVPQSKRYGREPWDDQLRAGLIGVCGKPVTDWRAGDIALIRWGKGEPSHVGILADHPDGGLSIIHAHNIHGVIEQTLSGNIRECVIAVFRLFDEGN